MKRFRYGMTVCMILLFIMVGIAGCDKEEMSDTGFRVYYLNKEITKILPIAYEPEETETEGMINEIIAVLSRDSDSVECKKPLRGDTEIVAWAMEDGQLQISFNSEYSQMDVVTEVLCRAAITLLPYCFQKSQVPESCRGEPLYQRSRNTDNSSVS